MGEKRGERRNAFSCKRLHPARANTFLAAAARLLRGAAKKLRRGESALVKRGPACFAARLSPMQLPRREFLKTTLAASAATAVSSAGLHAAAASSSAAGREYYEVRSYRLKPGASTALLDTYLEKGLLPALDRRGIKNVGAFTEVEVDKKAVTSKPKENSPLWVLIPHPSFESFLGVNTELNAEAPVRQAGTEYFGVPRANPVFDRIDTWLYLAFKGQPHMDVPAFSKNKTPTRIFEMREYQSHTEAMALNKIAMFEAGEIPLMKDLGMSPVFFGQGLTGPNLPHLRYITSGPDLAAHLAAWAKFSPDPRWKVLADDPQYKDNVSKNNPLFLVPRPYSAI